MYFVDGENLAMSYHRLLKDEKLPPHVEFQRDVFVWSRLLNMRHHRTCKVIRKHYYTSARGDGTALDVIHDRLADLGIEAPRVFRRDKTKGSKRVDVTLSVEMLGHAHRRNCDMVVLVAGDEDYVPLVQAVRSEGCRLMLWFFKANGLSPTLRRTADYFFDLGKILLEPDTQRLRRIGYDA